MEIKRNLLFFVDKEKTESGYKPDGKLRLRIRYASGKVDFNVGYRVTIEKWLNEAQRCKPGTSHGKKKVSATEINKEIQRVETLVNDLFKTYETKETVPSIEEFREEYNRLNGRVNEQKQLNFFDYFDQFIDSESKEKSWTLSTKKQLMVARSILFAFDPKITFDSLTKDKLNEWTNHLINDRDLRNVTAKKHLHNLRWFLKWATEKGYNTNVEYQTFNPKLKVTQKKVIFLSWDELMQLRDFQVPESKQYLDRVKDVFLFQCFTGLRHSDVYNLKRSNVKSDHIEVVTLKTNDSLSIELNDYSREILDKYKGVHFKDDKVLPVISNQKMNQYLKELGELAGIDEPISETHYQGSERKGEDKAIPKYKLLGSHAGRRTFICNALAMGIPAQTVMKWTGHSDYKAMKPYVDVADKDKKDAMEKWNKRNDILNQLKDIPEDKLLELIKNIKG